MRIQHSTIWRKTVCEFDHSLNIFSSPNTLTNKSTKVKSGVKGDANLLRPTLMCAVPLILERIYKSIVDTMRRQGWAVEELFHYFVSYKMKWQVGHDIFISHKIFVVNTNACPCYWTNIAQNIINFRIEVSTHHSSTKHCFESFDIFWEVVFD